MRKCSLIAFLLLFCIGVSIAGAQVQELKSARKAIDDTGYTGATLLYDVQRSHYEAGHVERIDDRFIPASTFKIFSSLVALETGVIDGADAIIEWDGINRERTELNRNLDLTTAFQLSAVPHYQQLVRQIGLERMQQFIDAVGYGNRDLSGGVDSFWLTGGLRISPREQVGFLARLHRGDLPFSSETMATIRDVMVTEQTHEYALFAKTGWAVLPGAKNIGWWVGWVERGTETVIFATVLEATSPESAFGRERLAVTRRVLNAAGVLDDGAEYP